MAEENTYTPLTYKQAIEHATIIKAIGDPTRMQILHLLQHHEGITIEELVRQIGASQPLVSHHLGVLSRAGVIERIPPAMQADRRRAQYTIEVTAITGVIESLRQLLPTHHEQIRTYPRSKSA